MRISFAPPLAGLFLIICLGQPHAGYSGLRARAYEDTLSLYLVDIHKKAVPARPEELRFFGDMLFPYMSYGRALSNFSKKRQRFRAVTLENDALILKQAVDLGGQVMVFRDKASGKDILQSSPSPLVHVNFAIRKGAHVAFPYTEHSFNSLEPWEYTTGETGRGAFTRFVKTDPVTGLSLTVTIVMPHQGAYIDLHAEMVNATDRPEKGMMWSLHALDYQPGLRLFFPAAEAVSHTGMDILTPLRMTADAVGYLMPIRFPLVDGVDLADLRNWPSGAGMYAAKRSGNWCGLHHPAQRRGFVKILDPRTRGLKFYADRDHAELFSGVSRSLEHYLPVYPGDTLRLQERIIPTTGALWLSRAGKRGFAGLCRSNDSIYADFCLCDPSGIDTGAHITTRLSSTADARSEQFPIRAGRVYRTTIWAPADGRESSVRFSVAVNARSILRINLPRDSIPLIDSDMLRGLPPDSVLALQASARRPREQRKTPPAPHARTPVSASIRKIFSLPRTDRSHVKEPFDHWSELKQLRTPVAAARSGRRTFLLCENALILADDSADVKSPGITYGFNAATAADIDSIYRDQRVVVTPRPLDGEWFGDLLLCGDTIVLTMDKRIEIRSWDGELLDTIGLPDWGGCLARNQRNDILVTLPLRHQVGFVSLSRRRVSFRSLQPFSFTYPWAATPTPDGWAIGSAVAKRILLISTDAGRGKTLSLPAKPPWRTQLRGLGGILWHPGLQCLLVSDLDNTRVVKVGLDGAPRGVFVSGGLAEDRTAFVHDLTLDRDGGVLLTQSYSTRNRAAEVKRFSREGRFEGVIGMTRAGAVQLPFHAMPYGRDKLLSYSKNYYALITSDTRFIEQRTASGYGWGTGLSAAAPASLPTQSAQAVAFDTGAGCFLADFAKQRVLHYNADLTFQAELFPPGRENDFTPVALVLDKKKSLHVLDGFTNAIFRFDPAGLPGAPRNGYRFRKSYGLDRRLRCQRLYRHRNRLVLIDLFANVAQYVGRGGRMLKKRRFDLPPRFTASVHWVETPEGHCVIKDKNSPQALVLPWSGTPFLTAANGLYGEIASLFALDDYPRWDPPGAPDEAVYACATADRELRYLDSRFDEIKPPVERLRTIGANELTAIAYQNDTLIAGVKDYQGFILTSRSRITPIWTPLSIRARHIGAILPKDSLTLGALTESPARYVEFDHTGVISRRINALPAKNATCFAYTPEGELIIPDNSAARLLIIDSEGNTADTLPAPPRTVSIVADSGGAIYALDNSGAVFRVSRSEPLVMVFSGEIEDELPVSKPLWMVAARDKLLVADHDQLRLVVLDREGRFFGAVDLGGPDGARSVRTGCATPDHTVAVVGAEGVFEIAPHGFAP